MRQSLRCQSLLATGNNIDNDVSDSQEADDVLGNALCCSDDEEEGFEPNIHDGLMQDCLSTLQ